jgi:hypothetical protein
MTREFAGAPMDDGGSSGTNYPLVQRGWKLKRDMEIVRDILISVEERIDLKPAVVQLPGYDPYVVARHVEMLFDFGYLDGTASPNLADGYRDIHVIDLSWSGHDFVGAICAKSHWETLKSKFTVAELAGLPLAIIKDVGIALVKLEVKRRLGINE